MHIPRATYRFQFNEHFRLTDALALVPYLHELGVSHIYASPLFQAAPHSAHGYDVCDFTRLNTEIGTPEDLERLVSALREKQMGLVLDMVPNHMGVGTPENTWWWDVLTNGEKSRFAKYFDIDWRPANVKLRGKILVPILSAEYETLLKKGEFQLFHEKKKIVLGYREHRFPLAPNTVTDFPKDNDGLNSYNSDHGALDKLIRRQNYLLEYHAHGDAQLNYRRFFAVSSLAALRVEDKKTFQAAHSLIKHWIGKDWIDGLRVDHPDGLRDPEKYLQQLRAIAPDAWIIAEKILAPGELLPERWPVQGTTGYDFLNELNGLFIDADGEGAFTRCYAEITGETTDYGALARKKKHAVLETLLAAELNRLTALLAAIAAKRKEFASISRAELRCALSEIIACFPVYRSYVGEIDHAPAATDIAVIKRAVHLACEQRQDLSLESFALVHGLLLQPQRTAAAKNFVARFQQLTGPVMAKGVEDTAFYCFNRFVSLNEVGGDPSSFGTSNESLHKILSQQQRNWPHSQLTTSSHDTKRAEDVRARLNVLSEIPETWAQTVRRWSKMNECHRQNNMPDRNTEYLFYQTLVGAWPVSEARAHCYMEKAALESKQHTTWANRNEPFETALRTFISETLRDPQFTTDLEHFVGTLAGAAAVNSLSQTLIKLMAPGVPDIYQGCELWDFSLVDPDNRRPVDFRLRQQLLAESHHISVEQIWDRRAEGLPKMWLIHKTLKRREQYADFHTFSYKPVVAHGQRAENVFAFSRGGKLIALVPRYFLKLNHEWQHTWLTLPPGNWRSEFSGEIVAGKLQVNNLLQKFPVALLVKEEND